MKVAGRSSAPWARAVPLFPSAPPPHHTPAAVCSWAWNLLPSPSYCLILGDHSEYAVRYRK